MTQTARLLELLASKAKYELARALSPVPQLSSCGPDAQSDRKLSIPFQSRMFGHRWPSAPRHVASLIDIRNHDLLSSFNINDDPTVAKGLGRPWTQPKLAGSMTKTGPPSLCNTRILLSAGYASEILKGALATQPQNRKIEALRISN